jgi:transposase
VIVFVDESGFSLLPTVRRTWAPIGQTPIIRHRFNWKRLHAVGAIACEPNGSDPRLHLQVQATPVNSDSTIAFLESLRQHFRRPILLIWDGLPAHRSRKATDYIADQTWLTVERLPPYAPELNPVEYLWSAVKTKDLANITLDTIAELEGRVERAYNRLEPETELLGGFLKASSLYA